LTSAVAGGEWSASRPCRFTPREKAPGTHWIGGWVDPRAGLDNMEKRKFLPYRNSNSDLSVVQPVGSRYTDCATPKITSKKNKYSRIKSGNDDDDDDNNNINNNYNNNLNY
jgi:hypothetical protein